MTIFSIIESLKATNSSNEKLRILNENRGNELLKQVFSMSNDPFMNFWQKKLPNVEGTPLSKETTDADLQVAIQKLIPLAKRAYTGNAAIDWLKTTLESVTYKNAVILAGIVQKDMRCGVGATLVNKVWPKLIHEWPVALCSAFSKKLIDGLPWKSGVIVQLKSDGARCNIVVENGAVTVFSRNGKPIETKGIFDSLAEDVNNVMIDGELLWRDSKGTASRSVGNGIVNKAIKGTITDKEASGLYLTAWDIIDLADFKSGKGKKKYEDRFVTLNNIFHDYIEISPSEVVYSYEEALVIYSKYIANGMEGAILKDPAEFWEDKRSKKNVKLKAEEDCDLEVTEWCFGEKDTKNEHRLGRIRCKTSDGIIEVSVGTGFKDEDRDNIKPEDIVGRIVTVRYNMKIQASDGTWSLFLPRFICIREDKDVANTFDELV